MTSRDRLIATLNHREPDHVCTDLGATAVTGIHVSALARLRCAVLGDASWRVKVIEPYQMLGEVDAELRTALGIDVVGLIPRATLFGFENEGWKPFTMFDGTEVLVPANFVTSTDVNGDLLIHPQGDQTASPRGRMPNGAHFFDTIVYQEPVDDDHLDPADNCEEFGLFTDADIAWYKQRIDQLAMHDSGIIMVVPGVAFGDIALVPAPWLKQPKGIRDIEEWYVSTAIRKDYVKAIFEKQCEIGLKNIETLIGIVGDKVQAVMLTGTDFGTQRGPFISTEAYRELFKPYHQRITGLVHRKSSWKTFMHSCGSVYTMIPEFIEAGFDILNPVQCSACDMEPRRLKKEFGKDIVFWGGGANTQHTLEFGIPDEVYREVRERIEILAPGGGFVFNPIHNIQATTPTENLRAMFKALEDARR